MIELQSQYRILAWVTPPFLRKIYAIEGDIQGKKKDQYNHVSCERFFPKSFHKGAAIHEGVLYTQKYAVTMAQPTDSMYTEKA